MRKINTKDIAELSWSSPKGKFVGAGKQVSEELGRKPQSTDLKERHPFDVEIVRIPPTEEQALRSRGEDYRRYQQETSIFVPWVPKRS